MRILHLVKTSEGALWAAWQAAELVRLGFEIHVALPHRTGKAVTAWKNAGAILHYVPLDFPVRSPWRLPSVLAAARRLVADVAPDLIHSHSVGTTLVLRYALGKADPVPRFFQVPGPLHMEHRFFRSWDLSTAGPNDYWIGSSRCVLEHYRRAGIPEQKLFLSYYGIHTEDYVDRRTGRLRERLGIRDDQIVVGNINYMYAPKYYLGQFQGLKCHEDVIDALGVVTKEHPEVVGVLIGGGWGRAAGGYERKLRERAKRVGKGRILMPGHTPLETVKQVWADFDCAVHVPLSENCGGVLEPLLAGVPTIGGRVGGIPELIIENVTGKSVAVRDPSALASAMLHVISNISHYRQLAIKGQELVRHMWDVRRTAREVAAIYKHVVDTAQPKPEEFDSIQFVGSLSNDVDCDVLQSRTGNLVG